MPNLNDADDVFQQTTLVLWKKFKGDVPDTQFFVNNDGGDDSYLYMVGLASIGDELRFTLRRVAGRYSLEIENYTTGEASTLTNRHPDFLDGARDIHVGLFAATPESREPKTLFVQKFKVIVWARTPDAGRRS